MWWEGSRESEGILYGGEAGRWGEGGMVGTREGGGWAGSVPNPWLGVGRVGRVVLVCQGGGGAGGWVDG